MKVFFHIVATLLNSAVLGITSTHWEIQCHLCLKLKIVFDLLNRYSSPQPCQISRSIKICSCFVNFCCAWHILNTLVHLFYPLVASCRHVSLSALLNLSIGRRECKASLSFPNLLRFSAFCWFLVVK